MEIIKTEDYLRNSPTSTRQLSTAHLRVTLAAVGANVGLDMFGLLVLRNMLQQRSLVSETLVAALAFVRLVRLMTSRMRLKVRQLREGLGAT